MKRREFVQIVVGLGVGMAGTNVEPKYDIAPSFLTRKGVQLFLNGQPFRSLGVNKHELFSAYYLADFFGGDRKAALSAARRSLDNLVKSGLTIIRFNALPHWSAQIEDTYMKNRDAFWQRFDEMVKDCRERDIRLIPVLLWNIGAFVDIVGESLQDFANHPRSKSRVLFNTWVEDIVTRYRDDPTVLFWEITNEANLTVDLRPMSPQGVVPPTDLTKPHKHLTRNPGPRDWRNNWSADEMAAFVRETAVLIKSIDKNHLVAAGYSAPRPSAWHLWLGSLKRAKKMDWTKDSEEEQANFVRLVHPEPLDFVGCHFYLEGDKNFDQLVLLKQVANELDKPFYVGEVGISVKVLGEQGYAHPAAQDGLRLLLEAMETLDVPLVLIWAWEDFCRPPHEPNIRFEVHKDVVVLLREAQSRWRANTQPSKREISDAQKQRLQSIAQRWREIVK
ncbi:MAG: cellulase family glycosylhydrolase [Armatimonadota bacterium]